MSWNFYFGYLQEYLKTIEDFEYQEAGLELHDEAMAFVDLFLAFVPQMCLMYCKVFQQ